MNNNSPKISNKLTQNISTMQRKQKWETYRLAKRNVYFPDTTINFIRGKYMGKKE